MASDLSGDYVPDEVLVKFASGVSKGQSDALVAGFGAQVAGEVSALGVDLLRASDENAKGLVDALYESGLVEYAELNYVAHAFDTTPNDPSWSSQYGPQRIQAPQAWDVSTGSTSVIIAVIDTGVDLDHPDLVAKIVPGCDFVNLDDNAQDDHGHGTHVAGIAAAVTNNGVGTAGVSWGGRIMPLKVLGSDGYGSTSAIAGAIIFAADNGAHVINLSLGGGSPTSTMENAVNYAVEHGVTVIAAAGNSGDNSPQYPAGYENTIAVANTDSNNDRWPSSTYGDFVDVAAPGAGIYNTCLGNTYCSKTGTSMAAPHVAGAAAVLIGYSSNFNTPARVRAALQSTALDRGDSGWDQYYGHGIIQLHSAIQSEPGSEPQPTYTSAPTSTPNSSTCDYLYVRSDTHPGEISFSWIDASGGTRLSVGDDDFSVASLPFTFTFKGQPLSQIYVVSNGLLAFSSSGATTWTNRSIPSTYAPNNFITPFWDDLNPAAGGDIYYTTVGNAPNRKFVVEWNGLPHYPTIGSHTFQAILYEGSDEIVFQYASMSGTYAYGASATIGLEYAAGTSGLQFSYNQANAVSNELAVRYYQGHPCSSPATSTPTSTPTVTATPTPTYTPTPTSTPTPSETPTPMATRVQTSLTGSVTAGTTILPVVSNAGMAVGDTIRINSGGTTQEDKQIAGFGSLVLATGLQYPHEAGETIIRLVTTATPTPTTTATETPTLTPTSALAPKCWEGSSLATSFSGEHTPDQVLVKFDGNTADWLIAYYLDRYESWISAQMEDLDVTVLRVPRDKVMDVVNDLRRLSIVEFAEPNYLVHSFDTTPNDPSWSSQYGPERMQGPQAWDVTTGSSNVTIAVVDTGVDLDHADLAAKIVPGCDFINLDEVADDDNGHGTHVAGTAAAVSNNGVGVAGVSWGARIMPVKVLNSSGSGSYQQVAAGITWAADNGAQVINLSLGGSYPSSTMEEAVNYAAERGVTVVAAAGNSGSATTHYPSAYASTIAVASTDSSNNRSSFSTYGDFVDVAAPGSDIYSTYVGGGYTTLSGTSMATPHVAGAVALLYGYSTNLDTAAKIRTALESSALDLGTSGRDDYYGHGLIQVHNALVFDPSRVTPTTTPTVTPVPRTYYFTRSDTCPTDVAYSWVDASDGTSISLSDDASAEISLPFSFALNDHVYSQIYVSSNGFLTFSSDGARTYSNASIPSESAPNELIAPFWDDLDPSSGGNVYYTTVGSVPNRKFVVEWNGLPHWGPAGGVGSHTFQALMIEGTTEIVFQYGTMSDMYAYGSSATIGLEYAGGGAGTQFSFNAANAVHSGLAIKFDITNGAEPTPAPTCIPAPTATHTPTPTITSTPTVTPTPTATVAPSFVDVPLAHPYYRHIEALYDAGYVAGCSTTPRKYCPEKTMSRAESAVFVVRGNRGASYLAPQPSDPVFEDISLSSWAAKWAVGMWTDGFTAGCSLSSRKFCPWQGHTRVEGTVFYLRILMGQNYVPPAPEGIFSDMSTSYWGTKWAEAAWRAGLILPCETTPQIKFCPNGPLDRGLAAYMMVQAKNLPLSGFP